MSQILFARGSFAKSEKTKLGRSTCSGIDSVPSESSLRTKARLEDSLGTLSIPLHVLRPSFVFSDLAKLPRAKRIWLMALGRSLVTKYRPTDAHSLARAMVAAAMSPGAGTHVYHHDEIRVAADRF